MNRVRQIVGNEDWKNRGNTGSGVGIAILDTGIYEHRDLEGRIAGFFDAVNGQSSCYDDNGHGTHIAGIAGGSGRNSNGKYKGIATECHFIGVKILDRKGNGMIRNLVNGIEWILENRVPYRIRIANISVGMFPKVGSKDRNLIIQSVERLWDEGIVVVAAAGNNGPRPGSITYPGISRKVITVGTIQEKRNAKIYSGRGPTGFCVMKPEVIAPGLNIMSCLNKKEGYTAKSGTSMATPVVSGAIACLLEKYPELTPMEVKLRLRDSAMDLGFGKNVQGWGQLWIPDLLA